MAVDDKKRILAEGLLKAIKAEQYGHNFYLMAANSTEDLKGKEVFETLAREEADHMQFLKAQYTAIMTDGKPDESIHLGVQADLSGMSPIFSDSLRSRIKEANFEMTSLSVGIQLEHDAMDYYKSQADSIDDPVMKSFYNRLAEWERGHYQALLRQQDDLKDDFWAASGFSPF